MWDFAEGGVEKKKKEKKTGLWWLNLFGLTIPHAYTVEYRSGWN
jgi:hypothetical protein